MAHADGQMMHESGRASRLRGHIPGLDGLRGAAILLVMIHHMTVFTPVSGVGRWISSIADFGWCGVDLFFVLSGFLITGILVDAKGRRHYFLNFYARRTVRIFPLYYAVVIFSLIVLPLIARYTNIGALENQLAEWSEVMDRQQWYWLYLSNFSIAYHHKFAHGILDVSWSLAIEEQFYLIWPALVFLLNPRAIFRMCCVIIVLALLLRAVLISMEVFDMDWWFAHPMAMYTITFCRMDALAMGGLLAILARRTGDLKILLPIARKFLLAGLAVVLACLALDSTMGWKRVGELSWSGYAMQSLGYTALAITFGGLLVLSICANTEKPFGRFMNGRFMSTFGKFSYALYLFHLPIRAVLREVVPFFAKNEMPVFLGTRIPIQLAFYIVSTIACLLAAWVSWHLYEKQFLKLKRFFPYNKPK